MTKTLPAMIVDSNGDITHPIITAKKVYEWKEMKVNIYQDASGKYYKVCKRKFYGMQFIPVPFDPVNHTL